jgi:N-sulfoglucosamine sulfohydrolase
VCSPSRASILTGLYAHQNGQIGLATHKFAMFQNWPNIPSLMKKAGYRTGIIGKLHVNPANAFPFDFKALGGSNFNDRPMQKFADFAGNFIGKSDKPFFLMVNFPDAHFPLLKQQHGLPTRPMTAKDIKQMLPEVGIDSPRLRKHAADYYNCLMRLDSGIGLLLKQLDESGKASDTLVIYLSDHGAQFSRGKTTSYEGGLRVPMIVRWPKRIKAGLVREELVSSIDILPTILDAVGTPSPGNLPGRSLLSLGHGEKTPWRRYLFTGKAGATAFWTFPQRTIRDDRYKLILNLTPNRPGPTAEAYENHWGTFFEAGCTSEEISNSSEQIRQAYAIWRRPPAIELYDLKTDPLELRNLATATILEKVKQRLLLRIRQWQQETGDPFANKDLLTKYLAETTLVSKQYGGSESRYRRDPAFRWKYLDYLAPETKSEVPRSQQRKTQ